MTDNPTVPWVAHGGSEPTRELEQDPSAEQEKQGLFRNPEERDQRRLLNRRIKLENRQFKRDIKNREHFAEKAYGFTQAWIGFLFVLTSCQFAFEKREIGLTQSEFITVLTTTTASILAFWLLVGKYLFKTGDGDKEARKLPEKEPAKER